MPKSWPTNMTTAIAGETMGIATCFQITRQDGEVFRFTDHDVDIVVSAVADETDIGIYKAASGYTRSTMASKEDLSVDTLDMEGLIQAEVVTDADLRAGKYDHAEFEMFLVDWQGKDPEGITDDEIGPLRKGRLGQLSINDDTYEVEFRGLKQALGVVQGGVIQPVCRVDVFSTKCGLVAASYENPGVVNVVTDNRQFTVEAKETIAVKFDLTDIAPYSLGASVNPYTHDITDLREVTEDEAGGLVEASGAEDGTRARPFILSSTTDFNTTFRDSAAEPGTYWAMDQDVDFSGFGDFAPIPVFAGFFDGRGFDIDTIDLLRTTVLSDADWAFIRYTSANAVFKRTAFVAPQSGTTMSHAGLAVIVGRQEGILEDCYTDGGQVTTGTDPFDTGAICYQIRPATSFGDESSTTRWRVPSPGHVLRCWSSTPISGLSSGGNNFRVGGAFGFIVAPLMFPNVFPAAGGEVVTDPTRGLQDDCWFDSDVTTWNVTNGILLGGSARENNMDSTSDVSGTTITTPTTHGISSGTNLVFRLDAGALPLPLEENTVYWAESLTTTTLAVHRTRKSAVNETASGRITLTDQTGTFSLFGWSTPARKLTTAEAKGTAAHPNLDTLSYWKTGGSDYPRHLDPGRDGGGTVTGPMVRTRGVDVSSLGTYQSSAVRWTATTPGASSVTVYASTDGETFTSIASTGDPVPGLTAGVTSLAGLFVTLIVELTISGSDRPTLTSLEFEMANNTNQFVDAVGPPVLSPEDDDWFVKGNLTWNTGKNTGLSMEVKTWDFAGLEFKLFLPMAFDVEPGDSFTVLPGCRKRSSEDCNTKYDNIENFRAEPHVPGNDKYLAVPDSTGGKS